MKTQKPLIQPLGYVAVATLLILLVPFIAMQFTTEVNWSPSDFVIMGILIFGTGLTFAFVLRRGGNLAYRAASILAVASAFLLIYVNLAVGLIGGGPNTGNLMYIGVLLIGITGAFLAHFRSEGMERVMYATVGALVVLVVIALMAGMQNYPGSSVKDILAVNGFFALLFFVAALLYRYSHRSKILSH